MILNFYRFVFILMLLSLQSKQVYTLDMPKVIIDTLNNNDIYAPHYKLLFVPGNPIGNTQVCNLPLSLLEEFSKPTTYIIGVQTRPLVINLLGEQTDAFFASVETFTKEKGIRCPATEKKTNCKGLFGWGGCDIEYIYKSKCITSATANEVCQMWDTRYNHGILCNNEKNGCCKNIFVVKK